MFILFIDAKILSFLIILTIYFHEYLRINPSFKHTIYSSTEMINTCSFPIVSVYNKKSRFFFHYLTFSYETNAQLKYDKVDFPYLLDRVCSIFSGAGKFCLAHGLRQLTRHV